MNTFIMQRIAGALAAWAVATAAVAQGPYPARLHEVSPEAFRNPSPVYRPIATLSDHGVSVDVLKEEDAAFARGYGSVLFSPSPDPHPSAVATPYSSLPLPGQPQRRPMALQEQYPPEASKWLPKALPGEARVGSYMVAPAPGSSLAARLPPPPGNTPDPRLGYMTPAYFARVSEMLTKARAQGRFATYYDEAGFPSGMADHTTPEKYRRKILTRLVSPAISGATYAAEVPQDGTLLGAVAVNAGDGRRVDLMTMISGGKLHWKVPEGAWNVQTFMLKTGKSSGRAVDYNGSIDYMDHEAVQWFIGRAYEPMAKNLSQFFGNTLNMTFFDDVGVYSDEHTWSTGVNARFRQNTGRDASTYYPALWDDIGPDTAAARTGLFGARASLLGEGFPKLVNEWDDRHGLQATGHAPGNYDLQPEDMNGDPFKFYRYARIPMVDVIFGHGFGRSGYKLISSAADEQDKPLVVAEAFSAGGDVMGYRRLIELYVRGINRFVTSAVPRTEAVGAPADFSEWAGRTSLLLQGGRHVADIAILYPNDDLAAFYSFEAKQNVRGIPAGSYVSNDTDYQAVGEMLVSELHRDFSFLHPETLASAKVSIHAQRLTLENKTNSENFSVLLLPGARVISVAALRKAQAFYEAGGIVLATSLLPAQSAEFGKDIEVQAIVRSIFRVDPARPMPDGVSKVHTGKHGGKALFLRDPSPETLTRALQELRVAPDVAFSGNPAPVSGNGCFGYIHKVKEGADIYYFGNSSDTPITTTVRLRGALKLQLWDPATGSISPLRDLKVERTKDASITSAALSIPANSAMFLVSEGPGTRHGAAR